MKSKEDWDVKVIQDSREENFENRESNPYRNTKYFFGFDLKIIPNSLSYARRSAKRGNKRIFYYGK